MKKAAPPRELPFFVVLIGEVLPCYIAQRYRFVTQPVASCQASGGAVVLHPKFDIFCHLSIFFLTRSFVREKCLDAAGKVWYSTR